MLPSATATATAATTASAATALHGFTRTDCFNALRGPRRSLSCCPTTTPPRWEQQSSEQPAPRPKNNTSRMRARRGREAHKQQSLLPMSTLSPPRSAPLAVSSRSQSVAVRARRVLMSCWTAAGGLGRHSQITSVVGVASFGSPNIRLSEALGSRCHAATGVLQARLKRSMRW